MSNTTRESRNDEVLFEQKYFCLLKGLTPEFYKDHILKDKINLLYKENAELENMVLQLRHEISNLIEKKKHEVSEIKNEKVAYKYHALSTTLAKCLENSGFELSRFSDCYDEAIKALNK